MKRTAAKQPPSRQSHPPGTPTWLDSVKVVRKITEMLLPNSTLWEPSNAEKIAYDTSITATQYVSSLCLLQV